MRRGISFDGVPVLQPTDTSEAVEAAIVRATRIPWEFYCEHANENPNVCLCQVSCGCRQAHCREKPVVTANLSVVVQAWHTVTASITRVADVFRTAVYVRCVNPPADVRVSLVDATTVRISNASRLDTQVSVDVLEFVP